MSAASRRISRGSGYRPAAFRSANPLRATRPKQIREAVECRPHKIQKSLICKPRFAGHVYLQMDHQSPLVSLSAKMPRLYGKIISNGKKIRTWFIDPKQYIGRCNILSNFAKLRTKLVNSEYRKFHVIVHRLVRAT